MAVDYDYDLFIEVEAVIVIVISHSQKQLCKSALPKETFYYLCSPIL